MEYKIRVGRFRSIDYWTGLVEKGLVEVGVEVPVKINPHLPP